MPPRRLGRVKHGDRIAARRDDHAIGKADPLAAILIEKLAADAPLCRLVLATIGMDLPGDLRG
jgi:hypothetical protein